MNMTVHNQWSQLNIRSLDHVVLCNVPLKRIDKVILCPVPHVINRPRWRVLKFASLANVLPKSYSAPSHFSSNVNSQIFKNVMTSLAIEIDAN